jgi:exodeoxyribonuclease V alpha subunit
MEEVVCKISGVVFSNRGTGFHILKASKEGGGAVTVKGTFPGASLSPGVKAKFKGSYEEHPTYGRQFGAVSCEVIPEKGRIGIITYLTNHVKSIGPITAGKMYGVFGDDLTSILENEPEKVLELDFLTKKQAAAIIEEWKQASAMRTAAVFLTDLGLNATQVRSAYSRFGGQTSELVKENPYRLYECPSIGFQTADTAARNLGIGKDDSRRVHALILFVVSELSFSEGHMYVSSQQILDHAQKIFRRYSLEPFSHGEYISNSHYFAGFTALVEEGSLVSFGQRIYLAPNWYHESEAANCIGKMIQYRTSPFEDLTSCLEEFEEAEGITLSENQRKAFMLLEESRVCVISGYPGTGKTLLISTFVHLFEELGLHYVLLSPTGIAAKRLSQMTGKPAATIHRALGYGRDGTWEFHSGNRYIVDAVIVDETSMVDGSTFYHLVSALPSSTVLVLVGDSAQLPSVGAGYVLNNLMACPDVPHVSLTQIYRQEEASDIVSVAHSILAGVQVDTSFNKTSDFVFLPFVQDDVIDEIKTMTTKMMDRKANFQVIAPMYDGDLGVNNLNRSLREVLNPRYAAGKASKLKHGACDLYEGDCGMVVKNDYDRMVFNGDVGKVQRISIRDDEVEVRVFDWFDQDSSVPRYIDKVFIFKVEEARHVLRVAYACTTHKVQGQEFDYVLMPMTMRYGIMLYRNLLYTAITRAKKKVFVFGDRRAFAFAVGNDRETVRNSSLDELISERSQPDSVNPPSSRVGNGKEDTHVEKAASDQTG